MRAYFLLALLLALFVQAQNQPEVKVNHFQNLPARLYFFDDATVCRPHIHHATHTSSLICSRMSYTMILSSATSTFPPTKAKIGSAHKTYQKERQLCS